MGAAFRVIDIVAETQHILVELIYILQSHFHRDAFRLPFIVDHVMDRFLGLVHILDETDNPLRFMILNMFNLFFALVLIDDRQRRIQIGCLVKTTLDLILLKPRPVKYGVVRQKIDGGAGFLRLPHHRQKAFLQFQSGDTALIAVFIDIATGLYRHMHMRRQGIHHGRAYAVQTAAGLIGVVVELAARMERGKYQTFRADPLLMHPHRNAASVVRHGGRTVRFQRHMYRRAETRQMFIHRIVHDLIDQMIQALGGHTADIHARPDTYCLQPFQHGNAGSVIIVCRILCHLVIPLVLFSQTSNLTDVPVTQCPAGLFPPFIHCTGSSPPADTHGSFLPDSYGRSVSTDNP